MAKIIAIGPDIGPDSSKLSYFNLASIAVDYFKAMQVEQKGKWVRCDYLRIRQMLNQR